MCTGWGSCINRFTFMQNRKAKNGIDRTNIMRVLLTSRDYFRFIVRSKSAEKLVDVMSASRLSTLLLPNET